MLVFSAVPFPKAVLIGKTVTGILHTARHFVQRFLEANQTILVWLVGSRHIDTSDIALQFPRYSCSSLSLRSSLSLPTETARALLRLVLPLAPACSQDEIGFEPLPKQRFRPTHDRAREPMPAP